MFNFSSLGAYDLEFLLAGSLFTLQIDIVQGHVVP